MKYKTGKMPIRLPEPYMEQWKAVLKLAQKILEHHQSRYDSKLWPIMALCKKAAATTKGIAALASLELWSDGLVLHRTLTDTEVIIRWLLNEDTENRIQLYISGIDQEKKRLLSKMATGRSASAQMLADLVNATTLISGTRLGETGRGWSRLTIRDMAREVDMERIYDLPYWVSSAFIHSHALSILSWNDKIKQKEEVLAPMFDQGLEGLPRWLVLGASPSKSLHIFMLVDKVLQLGIERQIQSAWTAVRNCLSEASEGAFTFSDDIEVGNIVVRGEHHGIPFEKIYSPRRTSNHNKRRRNATEHP